MLTIAPLPRSTIDGSAARQVWNAAVRSVRDDLVPLRRLDLEERPDQRPPGVVDEAVDPPEPLDDPLDERARPAAPSAMSARRTRRPRRRRPGPARASPRPPSGERW